MPHVTFVNAKGIKYEIDAAPNQSLMEIAIAADIPEIEGACGGSLACATCHVRFDEPTYERLTATFPISPEETDMLDIAYGRQKTSRLCCQIILKPEEDGLIVFLP